MITSHHIRFDHAVAQSRLHLITHDEIVQSPADVPRPRIAHVAPPSVSARFIGVQMSEGVEEAAFQHARHPVSLLLSEAGILLVGLRVGQVNFQMRDVEVAAQNNRLLIVQPLDVLQHVLVPLLPVAQTDQAPLRVGHVRVDEEKFVKLQGQSSALGVVLLLPDSLHAAERVLLAQHGHPAVPLLVLRFVPVVFVLLLFLNFRRQVFGGALCFLETDYVGVVFQQPIKSLLFDVGADAVDVPRSDLQVAGSSTGRVELQNFHFRRVAS